MAKDVLKIAAGEIGNTENPAGSNQTKYGVWYGWNGVAWCMIFVQWCFAMTGLPLPFKTASCSELLAWYRRNHPECVVTQPKPRDIIIFNFGHTGIVESSTAGTITTIEGNTSSDDKGSQSNGGGVFRRVRGKKLVTAYIRPFNNYTFEEDIMTGKEIYDALNDYLKTQKVPAGVQAEYNEAVKQGITDGTNPCQLVPRWQAALMAKRAREGK